MHCMTLHLISTFRIDKLFINQTISRSDKELKKKISDEATTFQVKILDNREASKAALTWS